MAVEAQFSSENMGFSHTYYPQDCLFKSSIGIDDVGRSLLENSIIQPQVPQISKLLGPINNNRNRNKNFISNQVAAGLSSTSSALSGCNFPSMDLFQSLASELEKQRIEVDSYLQFQNEKLRLVLQEQTRQRGVLLEKYASKLMGFITQKEHDLAIAHSRTMELQQHLRRTSMESKAWKKKAIENESLVMNLTNKINQVNEKMLHSTAEHDDQESVCGSSVIKNNNCKVCHAHKSCVILIPCRHLCCCKTCATQLGFCPVCETVKEQSMEIFLV